MPFLHLLGTGAALADASRTTTMLAFQTEGSVIVVDGGGDVVHRLLAARVPLEEIEAMIITHEHPDHVGGFPLFMEKIWLAKRRRPIPVHGPRAALDQARRIFEAFDTSGWKGLPEIEWHEVACEEGASVLDSERWRVTAAPGEHSVPVIGIRVEDARGGGTVCYSADTAKADSIIRLAEGVDVLVHEAGGDHPSHATAAEAAEAAREAGAGRLILVHIPQDFSPDDLERARNIFGRVELGTDGERYEF